MRSLLLVLPFVLSTALHAQQWNWAADAGGGGNTDFCWDIATDSQGNAYWVGSVSGTAEFGCATLTPGNTVAGVIAKYGSDGTCQWVRGITTGFYDAWVYGIAIDAEDRIYITGSCQGNTDFGNGIMLSGSGSSDDWFTARYDVDGSCIWAERIASSTSTSEGRGIAVDEDGGIYVTGFAGGSSYTFGDITVNSGGFTRQTVIVKYDGDGSVLWARSTNGSVGGRCSARGIAVAGDRLFVTGQVYFATTSYQGLPISTVSNTMHAFVLACDLDGDPLWAQAYGGGDNEGYAIAADTLGNVFMTGRMWGDLDLPDDTLTSASSDDDILLMGFSTEGDLRWAERIGAQNQDDGWSVACDGQGNAYFSASFENTVDVFGTPFTALGSEDALIMKIEADGDPVWAARPSGNMRDIPLCIHRSSVAPHDLYFGGYYSGPITFGSTTIDDTGNGDAMLVMGVDTTFDASTFAGQVCPGLCDGEAVAFANGAAPFTYAWSNGATTSSVADLCPGEYLVEVTDAEGNSIIDTVRIAEAVDPGYTIQQDGDSLWIEGGVEWQWRYEGQLFSAGTPYLIAEANGTYAADYVDGNGCMWSTDEITVVLNVGVQEVGQQFVLYPNPANHLVYVQGLTGAILNAVAVDVLGRATEVDVDKSNGLDITHLVPGAWMLQFMTASGFHSSRFIKE